jgi:hypothetical protein
MLIACLGLDFAKYSSGCGWFSDVSILYQDNDLIDDHLDDI